MSGPEDNPEDDHRPTKEERDAAMQKSDHAAAIATRDRRIAELTKALERIVAHEIAYDRGDAFTATEAQTALRGEEEST